MDDPFEELGVAPSFDLDLSELEARHRELSRTLHPDRFTGRPASERRMALDRAIRVNEAYRRLKNPITRAELLLKRAGHETDERSEPPAAPELLMEMMEQREALSEARQAKDLARVEALVAAMKQREAGTLGRLSEGFAGGVETNALRAALGELRYARRFFDEAEAILDDLG